MCRPVCVQWGKGCQKISGKEGKAVEKIIYRMMLDTMRGGVQKTLQGMQAGDKLTRRIEILLTKGGEAWDIPAGGNVTAAMYVLAPGAEEASINACEIVGDHVVYDVLPQDLAHAGIVKLQMKLISGGIQGADGVLAAPVFAIEVQQGICGGTAGETNPSFNILENVLAKAEAAYNARIVAVNIIDGLFRIEYADGSVYESDCLVKMNDWLAAELLRMQELLGQDIREVDGKVGIIAEEIDLRVPYGDIIHAINISEEGIRIDTSRLDVSGYVTFSSLADKSSQTIIDGGLIRTGVIRSDNFLDAQGRETGLGSLLNLMTGYAVFRGRYNYAWLNEEACVHYAEIEMLNGRIRIHDRDDRQALYLSHEGISTTVDGNEATGIIDFRSNIYGGAGSEKFGITIQTNGSPVALRSRKGLVFLNPRAELSNNYKLIVDGAWYDSDGNVLNGRGMRLLMGEWYDGEGEYVGYRNGLYFSAKEEDAYALYTVDANNAKGLGSSVDFYARNVYGNNLPKPVKSVKRTLDQDGRIIQLECVLERPGGGTEKVRIPVTYHEDGSVAGIGDMSVR